MTLKTINLEGIIKDIALHTE